MFADGQGTQASFSAPEGIVVSPDDSFALVTEGFATNSHRIRRIVIATGVATTLAGNAAGYADGVGSFAKFSQPRGIALSPDGSFVLISDTGNARVRRLDMSTQAVTTVAGRAPGGFADGTGSNAQFSEPFNLVIDPTGFYALIADNFNHRIRRLDIASSQVTTLAGSSTGGFADGVGAFAMFRRPRGISIDSTGTYALIADGENNRVRRIVIATAQVTTLAGTGSASAVNGAGAQATFNNQHAISMGDNNTFALIADSGNNRIRRIALTAPCSASSYCPAASSSATQAACAPGFYCAYTGMTAPIVCTSGSYCNATGLSAAAPCTFGSYCPPGSNASNACPAGSFCEHPWVIVPCSTGWYCPARTTAPSLCAAGSYCAAPSVQSACSSGAYCPSGSTAQAACPAGHFCTTPFTHMNCSVGAYCPAGSTVNASCSAGYFCPTPVIQSSCLAGYVCATTGLTAPSSICSVNTFSAANATFCSPCPPFSYAPVGSSFCAPCGACSGSFFYVFCLCMHFCAFLSRFPLV